MLLLRTAGFPVDQLSRAEAVTAYYGLGTYWKGDKGRFLPQNGKGHVSGWLGCPAAAADSTCVKVTLSQDSYPPGLDGPFATVTQTD